MLLPKELELLTPLQYQHPLLPIGADHKDAKFLKKKAPVNKYGGLLSEWDKIEGYTVKELWSHPRAIAIGIRCDKLFCLDFDGSSAVEKAIKLGLAEGENTWEVKRTTSEGYYKRIFAPSPAQLNAIPPNFKNKKEFSFKIKTKESTEWDKAEAIEFFCSSGRQVIVCGQHYETSGRYFWEEGHTPDRLREPTIKEWNIVLKLLKKYQTEKLPNATTVTKNKTGWSRMSECEICGRVERPVCTISDDKNTISCFHGLSYAPPTGLKKGEVIFNTWAYSKTEERSFGTFSTFVRHRPSPLELLERRLHKIG